MEKMNNSQKNSGSFLDKKPVLYGMIVLCIILMFASYMQHKKRKHLQEAASLPFYGISVEDVYDGTYIGETFTSFMHVQLQVTVQNHKITDIQVLENEGSRGQKVEPILERIIAENKSVVPAEKGEEIASLVFISCVDDALKKGIQE
ncbi:MAG: hypothetical protein K6A43_02660 [Treponema sp.]|nr:hypothetical protein [Treponema sp.]